MTPSPGRPNAILAGLRGRCPNCGRGPLFAGFLAVAERCAQCGFDLKSADAGDGPAVFIILIVGAVVGFSALITEIAWHPPVWVHLTLWLPLSLAPCLGLLRPFKGLLLALQFHHRSGELRNDEV